MDFVVSFERRDPPELFDRYFGLKEDLEGLFGRGVDLVMEGAVGKNHRFAESVAQTRILDEHIEITPGIAGGKPRIAGRRITVQNVVIWHERMGKSADEIATEYDLTLADVYEALAYYFDHRAEIDESIREGEALVEALRERTPSIVSRKLAAQEPRG